MDSKELDFKELDFKELDSKELDFKELGVLGYSDLLGLGVLRYSDLLGLGVPDEWASRWIGFWISPNTRDFWLKKTIRRRVFEGDYSKEWRTRYFLEWYLNLVPELWYLNLVPICRNGT